MCLIWRVSRTVCRAQCGGMVRVKESPLGKGGRIGGGKEVDGKGIKKGLKI